MTALDWVLLLIIVVSAVLGALRGLIGVVASFAAWLMAGLAAFHFGGEAGQLLASQGAPTWGESLSGYVLAFLAVWLLVTLLGWALRRLADSAGLTPVDRTLGLALGTARGVFVACALLLALGLSTVPREPVWRESVGVEALVPMASWMRGGVPDWMAQRMDLEGRGVSFQEQLHDQAQSLQATLPPGMTLQDLAGAAVPDANSEAAVLTTPVRDPKGASSVRDSSRPQAGVLETGAPGVLEPRVSEQGRPGVDQPDATQFKTHQPNARQGASGTTSDAALVH